MNVVDVVGIPAPQGSKRHVGNGVMRESSEKVAPWRQAVALFCVAAKGEFIAEGPVLVDITFWLPKPKAAKADAPCVKRPDLDKLVRSTLDGMTGVCFADDSQVVTLVCDKLYAVDGRTGARIEWGTDAGVWQPLAEFGTFTPAVAVMRETL